MSWKANYNIEYNEELKERVSFFYQRKHGHIPAFTLHLTSMMIKTNHTILWIPRHINILGLTTPGSQLIRKMSLDQSIPIGNSCFISYKVGAHFFEMRPYDVHSLMGREGLTVVQD